MNKGSIQKMKKNKLMKIYDHMTQADAVLIGAGSGLSAAAGADYMDEKSFAENYPGMVKQGFRMKIELMGYTGWSPELMWGYLTAHVHEVRFRMPKHPVYGRLLDLVKSKDYFVITSNVDAMFELNGFDKDRIYTPQGDYALLQCQKPCWNKTWHIKPVIDKILPKINSETQEITDPSVIPKCPNCGGPVFMNVRGGDWFVEEPYVEQAKRFINWMKYVQGLKLFVFEIGAGFNTPGVVRWPLERIVYSLSDSHFVRINPQWPDVPEEIKDRSYKIKSNAMDAITAIWETM